MINKGRNEENMVPNVSSSKLIKICIYTCGV